MMRGSVNIRNLLSKWKERGHITNKEERTPQTYRRNTKSIEPVGEPVGSCLVLITGEPVGTAVGLDVGETDGIFEGVLLGLFEGD